MVGVVIDFPFQNYSGGLDPLRPAGTSPKFRKKVLVVIQIHTTEFGGGREGGNKKSPTMVGD
jgi:hypothetical protein